MVTIHRAPPNMACCFYIQKLAGLFLTSLSFSMGTINEAPSNTAGYLRGTIDKNSRNKARDCENYNCYLSVRHPAAGLHLVRVQTPKLQLLFKQRPANVSWIVQLARSARTQNSRRK